MNYTISPITDLEIIKVTVKGKLNQDIRKEILLSSANELKKTNCKRLLIDLVDTQFDTEIPITDALTLITYMRSLGFPTQTKMAFLYNDAETHRRFFESAAQADGYALQYFCKAAQAIEWLCED